ncbi:iron-sulfur cluster assembly scaffold protein [Croceicoccus sp. YJ47]|uniref:iron-sulfur cluster assembly scaffold protein n=1 Tax=Croceicoccus sp. YJ47 TaxID=2798724 RepID=UPI001F2A835F|nr:iron-sulfur cluster assembly scaffold protein [Croceicoccus sp. YJ47]
MNAHRLYTPAVLAAATRLASFTLDLRFSIRGEARSPSCGSRVELGLLLGEGGKIAEVGIAAHACAVGQAGAAVFAEHAAGRDAQDIAAANAAMEEWVRRDGPQPEWPGLDLIAPARAYPGRHGAMLLAWNAAANALRPMVREG